LKTAKKSYHSNELSELLDQPPLTFSSPAKVWKPFWRKYQKQMMNSSVQAYSKFIGSSKFKKLVDYLARKYGQLWGFNSTPDIFMIV
jgi:hypothetical protein